MSGELAFVDSNIWLYALLREQDDRKEQIAVQLLQGIHPVISFQVIQEVCFNLLKKKKSTVSDVNTVIQGFEQDCKIAGISVPTIRDALSLGQRYSLSFWDSLIVACALQSGATTLYSEDMHDGLVIDKQLTIRNPFQ